MNSSKLHYDGPGKTTGGAIMSASTAVYRSRPIKRRKRRTAAQMDAIHDAIMRVFADGEPRTVRQVFYQLTSMGAIDKTEAQYKNTVVRLLTKMRRDGQLSFNLISDATRWMRKPRTYGSLHDALDATATLYRRAIWDVLPVRVEVWLEKDALAGVLSPVTAQWDVPLMVTRGYPSLTYIYEAASALSQEGKPAFIYYFGDWDPSGVDITRTVESGLREFAPKADICFERRAVTEQQITDLQLPSRPTKKTDSRSKNFRGDSVEVDAIQPKQLRAMVKECIVQHIDEDKLQKIRLIESQEQQSLRALADEYGNWGAVQS